MKGKAPRDPELRFDELVTRVSGGCWLWKGLLTARGYGKFRIGSRTDGTRRRVYAHRFAWERVHGPVPDGLELDHLCRNHACVCPAHLEPVTHRVNILRGESPYALNARKTHCLRGHQLTPENIYMFPDGGRRCRQCILDGQHKRRRRERQAHA